MFWLLFGLKLRLLDFLGKLVLPVEVAPVSLSEDTPPCKMPRQLTIIIGFYFL